MIDTNDAIGDDTLAALSAIEGIVRVRVIPLIKIFQSGCHINMAAGFLLWGEASNKIFLL